jgi:hypothetical protein
MTGFPSILSSGQATVTRQPNYAAQQFLLLCPNTVIWQTQPDSAVDGATPYASFDWNGTDAGDRDDVQVGHTVIFSTSSDYKATAFFRGRIRKAPDASTMYVNETSANLAVTDYVTVIDDFDIHERLERRTATNVAYKDWDITFTRLLPVISNLQSTYVDFSGAATVDFSFAPDVAAGADGATISSYLWDVADGSADPDTTTKDITVTFPGAATNEHRWVRLTATDSLGNSQYFVFEVYTVDRYEASPTTVLLTSDQVQISASIDEGYNATVRAWDGVSSVLDQTRVTIAVEEYYNGCKALAFSSGGTYEVLAGDSIEGATGGATAVVVAVDLDSGTWAGGNAVGTLWVNQQAGTFESENLDVGANGNVATIAADSINTPIVNNIQFIGRLRNENSPITGDTRHAVLQETAFTIEGFMTQLGHTIGPGTPMTYAASATAWNQIQAMDVGKIALFALQWHTTFLNICGLTLPSDITDYEWHEDYSLPPNAANAWIMDIIDDINAWLCFASDGECTIQRHASYAGVAGLDTILALQTNDAGGNSDFDNWALELDYINTNSQAIAGTATYNTTLNRAEVYRGQAPAQVYGPGWGTAPINQQIMKSDLSTDDARIETGSRVAAHLVYSNPHARISGTLKDGLWWITPAVHQLYTLTIASADTPRGRAYSSEQWICTEVGYSYDPQRGRLIPQHTFEVVTTGGNYGITVTRVIDVNDLGFPSLPPVGAGLQPFDPLTNYPIEDPDYSLPGIGAGNVQPDNPEVPEIGCDQLNVSMRTGASETTVNTSVFGEVYQVLVEGDGIVGDFATAWDHTLQLDTPSGGDPDTTYGDAGGYVDNDRGHYTDSVGWEADDALSGAEFVVSVHFDQLSSYNVTLVRITYDFTNGQFVSLPADKVRIYFDGGIVESTNPSDGSGLTLTWTGNRSLTNLRILLVSGYDAGTPPPSPHGSATLTQVYIEGYGDNPFVPAVTVERGDAFYSGYVNGTATAYGGGYGFRVDGSVPTVPPYNDAHQYLIAVVGTGNVLGFDFEEADLTDNSNDQLRVTICGPHMALSQLST